MPALARVASFWRGLFRRDQLDQDLDAEVRSYVEMVADEKIKRGMTPQDARRAALMELGGAQQVKEEVRMVRHSAFLDSLIQDVRYAARTLWKSPGFSLIAALVLALGIGANTAIFSVAYGVLLRPLPYPETDRLALVCMHFSPQNAKCGHLSSADLFDLKARNRTFQDVGAMAGGMFDVTGLGEAEQVSGARVTANFFSLFQAKPLHGRVFQEGEDRAASPLLAVVSEKFWRRRLNSDANAVGRVIRLNGKAATIVGVMPESFDLPRAATEIWTNLPLAPPTRRGPYFMKGVGRLRPGVTLAQAQAEMNTIGRQIEQENPKTYSHLTMPVLPFRTALVGDTQPALLAISGAVFFVLLISTVNVANLVLSRANGREREMALRLSLGAGKGRVLRQLLTESVMLALAGGAAGVILAYLAVAYLRAWNPGELPRIQDVHIDVRALGFTVIVSVVSGILFGLAPAIQCSRAKLNEVLKEGGRSGSSSARRRRAQSVFVVAEIALSFLLLAGAGLMLRSYWTLQGVGAGFEAPPDKILTMSLSPSAAKYGDDAAGIAFYQRLLARVQTIPGLRSVSIGDTLPPDRSDDYDTFQIEGVPAAQGQTYPAVPVLNVSPGYFETLGVPLKSGRVFDERDTATSPGVIIISETLAKLYFGGRNPVGMRMTQSGADLHNRWLQVVGVVGDVRYSGLDHNAAGAYYLPYTQNFPLRTYLVVRSDSAERMAPALRKAIREVDEDVVIKEVETMAQSLSDSVAAPRFRTWLVAIFAGTALLLAALGIYGVIAYSVTQRTQEIGIRVALGADRMTIVRMVAGQGMGLALAGIAFGIAGALALTRLISGLLFSVSATDPLVFAGVATALALVAWLASLLPARRAMRLEPTQALRYE